MKIITIGDNNIDTYNTSGVSYPGGNCPNVAAYAAMNGSESYYMGVVGKDLFGDLLIDGLSKVGVNVNYIRREDGLTSRDIVVSKDGERIFTAYDRSIIDKYPISLSPQELDFVASCDIVHSSIYSVFDQGEFERICKLGLFVSYDFSVEWQSGVTQVQDANYDQVVGFIRGDIVETICPLIDFAFFSCGEISLEDTRSLLIRAISLGCKLAIGTRGTAGSICYDGKTFYSQNAYVAPVVDTLGAGDSFISRFLISYIEKLRFFDTCKSELNGPLAEHDERDYSSKLLQLSLAEAAIFALRSCSLEGAFGQGKKLLM